MTLINYSTYCLSKKNTILPWKISAVNQPLCTFKDFYESEIKQQCNDGCVLSQVFTGKTKDSLDIVDANLIITQVIPMFGPFVKFTIDQEKVS